MEPIDRMFCDAIQQVSLRGTEQAAIGSGLQPHEQVILFPGDAITDGTRVRGL